MAFLAVAGRPVDRRARDDAADTRISCQAPAGHDDARHTGRPTHLHGSPGPFALPSVRFCARGANFLTMDMRSGVLFDTETLRDGEEEKKKQKNVKMREAEKQRVVPREFSGSLCCCPLFLCSLCRFFLPPCFSVFLSVSVSRESFGCGRRPLCAIRPAERHVPPETDSIEAGRTECARLLPGTVR